MTKKYLLLLASLFMFSAHALEPHIRYQLTGKYEDDGRKKDFQLHFHGSPFTIGEYVDQEGRSYSVTGKTYEKVRILHFDIGDANYEVVIPAVKGAQRVGIPVTLQIAEDEKRILIDRFRAILQGEPVY